MDDAGIYPSLQGTGLVTSSFGGQPAVSKPYIACGPRDNLTTAILAKTEHQVTQPAPSQAAPGLSR